MTINTETPTAAVNPARSRRAKTTVDALTPLVHSTSKSDTVIKLLLRAKGATTVELIAATGWQPHSVRAFLSGLCKKGRTIMREAGTRGELAYRIATARAEVRPTSTAHREVEKRTTRDDAAPLAAAA